jgi:hypothetical protein
MLKHALGSAMSALSILASVATGQLASSDQPIMPRGVVLQQGAPTGPASAGPEFVPAPFLQSAGGLSTDITMSALMQPERQLQGGVVDTRTSVVPVGGGDGGVIQYIDQPYTCDNAFYSNSNHNTNPYLTFEDFVADGSPLRNVKFYGGTTGDMFADVNYIGIEIWSIQSGGECGWTYASLQGLQIFTLAELNPSYVCDVVGAFPSYEMLANFSSPIALNAGQNYMITIYAGLNNPDGNLYFWNQSTVNNYNPSSSWDRNTGSYVRCGPDAAFSTNVNGSCFDQACSANTAYYSNYVNNTNPYIVPLRRPDRHDQLPVHRHHPRRTVPPHRRHQLRPRRLRHPRRPQQHRAVLLGQHRRPLRPALVVLQHQHRRSRSVPLRRSGLLHRRRPPLPRRLRQ